MSETSQTAAVPVQAPGVVGFGGGDRSVEIRMFAQLFLALITSISIGLVIAASGNWKVPAALLAVSALMLLGALRPVVFLGVFILVRPLVALVSSAQLVHGVASANANGLTSVLLVAVLLVVACNRRFFAPPGTLAFGWVLVISAVSAAYAMATLGGTVSGNPLSELLRLASMAAIYVLAANLYGTPQKARLMFALVALSAVVPAAYGLVQWIQGPPFVKELGLARITSTLGGGPNTIAAYLAPCALLFIAASGGLPKWVRASSLLVVLATLVGTYSREGWLMFLLGVFLYGWTRKRNLVLAVAVGALAISLAVPGVHNRVFSSTPKKTLGTPASNAYASLHWRIQNWGHLVDKYEQSPVFGFGLGTVNFVNPFRDPYTAGQGFPSHNSLLQILVEGGVVLLIPWLALLGVILGALWRMARQTWELREYARVTLVVWITVIVAGLITEDTLGTTAVMYIVLALSGCLVGARRASLRPGLAQPEG